MRESLLDRSHSRCNAGSYWGTRADSEAKAPSGASGKAGELKTQSTQIMQGGAKLDWQVDVAKGWNAKKLRTHRIQERLMKGHSDD